jgi:2-polyprenyl-3-methyl-5-hydroxy-6-metoxy-1,4-benzoquinol methylase
MKLLVKLKNNKIVKKSFFSLKSLYIKLRFLYDKYDQLRCKRVIDAMNTKLIKPCNLEEVSCYLCKSSNSTIVCEISGLKYQKCDSCGLVYVSPRLKESTYFQVYDSHYWLKRRKALGERKITERVTVNLSSAINIINLLSQFVSSGSLLDIGCGDGATVYAASIKDFDAYGIEVSDYLINYSKSIYPSIKIFKSVLDLSKVVFQKSFDLILLRDVIEHFYDPKKELKKINKILSINGYVYIETVNIDDPNFQKFPVTWCHSKPFEHPYLFGMAHVNHILEESGFEVVKSFKVVPNRYHLLAKKNKRNMKKK